MEHREWLEGWAQRLADSARAEISAHDAVMSELDAAISAASNSDERDYYCSIFQHHEKMAQDIKSSYNSWVRIAKSRWNLEMPDLGQELV